jgi:hypothetical protein
MTTTLYSTVNKRRTVWFPVEPTTKEKFATGTEEFMSRVLSLRHLELPVADFINQGLERKDTAAIGEEGMATLRLNIKDEVRHDQALSNCVNATENYTPKYESVVRDQLLSEWNTLSDHPILKALTLENGIFFLILPYMRKYGGFSLSTTAGDVSTDETVHVASHRQAVQDLNQRPSSKLNALRRATVQWILGDFNDGTTNLASALAISDALYTKGITSQLNWTKSASVPCFFEAENGALPYYS